MDSMFKYARYFNQSIEDWDVSNVIDMNAMFNQAFRFNQPIGGWDVSSVTDMIYMFGKASNFNQPIGNWDISSVTDMRDMFTGVTLSTANYDHLLLGWSLLILQTGVVFDAGDSICSEEGNVAKQYIIATYDWEIVDGNDKGISSYPLGFFIFFELITILGIKQKPNHH